jgi:hypothetical protein
MRSIAKVSYIDSTSRCAPLLRTKGGTGVFKALPVSLVELTVQCCNSNTVLECQFMRFIELDVEQTAYRCKWQSVQDPTSLPLKPQGERSFLQIAS